ncbi:AsnC family transcriptional regulator [Brevirhabdus pacifica]|nr:AsnC family transcriptional regulator [Brevirhabdus pacifica]
MIALDDIDRRLLLALAEDATLSSGALGRRLGLSQPAAWRRVRRLEEAGIIAGRRLDLDTERLGFGVTVFLGVKLATKGRVSLEDFERAVSAIPEVQTVQHVLGLYDYRLRIVARDLSDFERVLRRRLMTLPGVGEVEANVLLSEERLPGPLGVRAAARGGRDGGDGDGEGGPETTGNSPGE